jgi:undecaprenyl-diphosphatase
MTELFEAAFLGLVQGLTEFLPVSSSGHLAILQVLMGWEDAEANLAFNVALHVGSLLAVVLYVRKEIVMMLTARPRLLAVLVVATLPMVLAVPAKSVVVGISSSLGLVGALLIVNGFILWLAGRLKDGATETARLGLPRALAVGFAQLLAVLPGISRSGTSLTAALRVGLQREQAVRFVFLMAVPAIGAAAFLPLLEGGFGEEIPVGAVALGGVVSLLSSLVAMRLLVLAVVRRRLGWFAVYCVAAGLTAVLLGLTR